VPLVYSVRLLSWGSHQSPRSWQDRAVIFSLVYMTGPAPLWLRTSWLAPRERLHRTPRWIFRPSRERVGWPHPLRVRVPSSTPRGWPVLGRCQGRSSSLRCGRSTLTQSSYRRTRPLWRKGGMWSSVGWGHCAQTATSRSRMWSHRARSCGAREHVHGQVVQCRRRHGADHAPRGAVSARLHPLAGTLSRLGDSLAAGGGREGGDRCPGHRDRAQGHGLAQVDPDACVGGRPDPSLGVRPPVRGRQQPMSPDIVR
jgi:hypothetical protein